MVQNINRLDKILEQAWNVRQAFFPDLIEFTIPGKTLAVSVTGSRCALNCAHCGGQYLKKMVPLEEIMGKKYNNESSYLVSGGSDKNGKVPLFDKWDQLEKLADRGSLNLHTGLVNEAEAKKLSKIARVISFDFVGDNETIAKVYGLSATVDDYLSSYRHLLKYNSVIPHICVGLDSGRINSEYRALELLRNEAVEAICMIIFRPTEGTEFSAAEPPSPEEVARFIATARLMFPRTPLYLGCMRPGGSYREKVDQYAVKAGVNKIVLPGPETRRLAVNLGLSIKVSEECCSL
ncbi:MAG: radical SAM protein [Bacillota bacterium]|nr:radical SAM protein [Bacillota bacterium]